MNERRGKLERDELVATLVLGLVGAGLIALQGWVASRSQRAGANPDPFLGLRARAQAVRERFFPTEYVPEPTEADLTALHDEARRITREG